jgi:hypothetical protein
MRPFLQTGKSLPLDVLMPILIVSHSLEKFHEVHVLPYFLGLIEPGRPFDIDLPIELLNALADFLLRNLYDGLIIFDAIQILDDRLIVIDLSLIHDGLILGKEGELQLGKVGPAWESIYFKIWVPMAGEESLLIIVRSSSAESEDVNYS